MNFFGGGGGSSGGGAAASGYWGLTRRRRRRYTVARFRALYDSLLGEIAPPPPPPPDQRDGATLLPGERFGGEQGALDGSRRYLGSLDGRTVPTDRRDRHRDERDDEQEQDPQQEQEQEQEQEHHDQQQQRQYLNALGEPVDDTDADVPPLTKPPPPGQLGPDRDGEAAAASGRPRREQQRRSHRNHQQRQPDLRSAWRVLAATPSFDKEGDAADTALAVRDDAAVAALAAARSIESRVVEIIRSMGEVVVRGSGGDDGGGDEEIFGYFCDKNMLALLVDIAKAKPPPLAVGHPADGGPSSVPPSTTTSSSRQQQSQPFSGVVWTPLVKSQVLQTVSILVTNVKDDTSLYYLLSNNHVNDLVSFLVPLGQWTDTALEEMMPVYVSLLKTLALQLARTPHLSQFFVDDRRPAAPAGAVGGTTATPAAAAAARRFPLLHAAVRVASSSFAQSDAFVHLTALNIILNLCQIPSGQVRDLVGEATADQRIFLSHLCRRLIGRHGRVAHLTVGPAAGDPTRSAALRAEIADLRDQLHFVNDLLWCGVRPLNVRLCEYLLRYVLFGHVLPGMLLHRPPGAAGASAGRRGAEDGGERSAAGRRGERAVEDDALIREAEATAQASVLVLTQIFLTLEYTPVLKMVAVAVMHPRSPAEWVINNARDKRSGGDYVLTPALNAVVQNRCVLIDGKNGKGVVGDDEIKGDDEQHDDNNDNDEASHRIHAVKNPYRKALLSLLRGDLGDRRFILAAMLLQSILDADGFDGEILTTLRVLPDYSEASRNRRAVATEQGDTSSGDTKATTHSSQSPFEDALAAFFNRRQRSSSSVSALAMECGGSLALSMLSHLVVSMTANGTNFRCFHERFCSSSLVLGLGSTRQLFASEAQKLLRATALSDAFVDLVELEISRRYNPVLGKNGVQVSACNLNAYGAHQLGSSPEILVQKVRDASANEIEDAKFVIRMVLYFRSMCEVVVEVHDRLRSLIGPNSISSRWREDAFEIRTIDIIDDELNELSGQRERAQIGTDLDVRGRTFFYFSPSWNRINPRQAEDRKRRLAEDILMRATPQTELMIVLDPTELFVLKPNPKDGSCNRGTILCSASLRSVITAAPDKEWLHIAIRQMEDVGVLIKNGNMSLRFDSVGTCLIVKQYLERCRSALRSKLMNQVGDILEKCSGELFPSQVENEHSEGSGGWGGFATRQAPSNPSSHLGEDEEQVVLEQTGEEDPILA